MGEKIVFVIGAGASAGYHFPTGRELADIIMADIAVGIGPQAGGTPRYPVIQQAFSREYSGGRRNSQAQEVLLRAKGLLRDGVRYANSIDEFLNSHQARPEVVWLGKIAIAAIIGAHESAQLARETGPNRQTPPDDWMLPLVRMLSSSRSLDAFRTKMEDVHFVVFNYDRMLEHYLTGALSHTFGLADFEAAEVVEGLSIAHPYGSLGPSSSPFGSITDLRAVMAAREQIKTFTEADQLDIVNHLPTVVREAGTLVFLGFGFHKRNLEILSPMRAGLGEVNSCKFFCSGFGLSESDRRVVHNDIVELFAPEMRTHQLHICRENLGCSAFFAEFQREIGRQLED